MGVCCSVWKWISSPSCMSSASSTSSARAALPTPLRACAGFSPAATIPEVGLVAPAPTAHKNHIGIAKKVRHAYKKLKSWCCRGTLATLRQSPVSFLGVCISNLLCNTISISSHNSPNKLRSHHAVYHTIMHVQCKARSYGSSGETFSDIFHGRRLHGIARAFIQVQDNSLQLKLSQVGKLTGTYTAALSHAALFS